MKDTDIDAKSGLVNPDNPEETKAGSPSPKDVSAHGAVKAPAVKAPAVKDSQSSQKMKPKKSSPKPTFDKNKQLTEAINQVYDDAINPKLAYKKAQAEKKVPEAAKTPKTPAHRYNLAKEFQSKIFKNITEQDIIDFIRMTSRNRRRIKAKRLKEPTYEIISEKLHKVKLVILKPKKPRIDRYGNLINVKDPVPEGSEPEETKSPPYCFEIKLIGAKHPVWRRFYTPSDITLEVLGIVINKLMGWYGFHSHAFYLNHEEYHNDIYGKNLNIIQKTGYPIHNIAFTRIHFLPIPFTNFFPSSFILNTNVPLDTLKLRRHRNFLYMFDLAKLWTCNVQWLTVRDFGFPIDKPIGCVAGEGVAPKEDVSGLPLYSTLIEQYKRHYKIHEDNFAPALFQGPDYDPNTFVPEQATWLLNEMLPYLKF